MVAYGVVTGGIVAIVGASYLNRVFQIGEIGPAPFLYSTAIVVGVVFTASLIGDYSGLHLPINRRRNNRLSGMRLYLLFVEFEPGFAYHKRSVRCGFDESLFNQFFCGARFDRIALRFPTV
jgi:hypothetical protein